MRVLLTTDTIGGVWTFTREMCKGLLSSGHDVVLVSFGRRPSAEQLAWSAEATISSRGRFRYEALDIPLEWMDENRRAYSAGEQILLQIARELSLDVIHSNQFCFGALPLPIPKVITAHSDALSWASACRPNGFEDSPWLRQYHALVDEGLYAADAVVAPTRWMADALAHGFSAVSNLRVISNGRTLPPCQDTPERRLQAVSAGRLWDEAKQAGLLDELNAAMPVVLAGETSLCGEALRESDLLTLFRSSSVYIASSRYEPFGLAPLEAALCGCAVVANDIPSLREVWGDAALYFSGRERLKELLEHLVEVPGTLRSAQERSYARALHFSASRMVQDYLSLYEELITNKTRGWFESKEAYA